MSSEVGEHPTLIRIGRRPVVQVLLRGLVLVALGGGALAMVRSVAAVLAIGFGTVIVGCCAWLMWARERLSPLVALSSDGLAARDSPLARMPDPVEWPTIGAFKIVRRWRRHPVPFGATERFLAVFVEAPNAARWQTISARRNVKSFGTPFVLAEYFIDGSLETVVDAARAFTDAPLTYASERARRPPERWRASRSV